MSVVMRIRVIAERTSAQAQPCWFKNRQAFTGELAEARLFGDHIEAARARPAWAAAVTFHEVGAV